MATINTLKEQAVTSRPLLLADIVFPDGTTRYYSTHNGDSAHGGYAFGGHDYLPRIDEQEIERFAALSEMGVDRIPSVTLRLADPDGVLWTNDERAHGYRGADLTLTFAMFDPITGAYSTDSFAPFVGICEQPKSTAEYLTVVANSKMGLSRFMLPPVAVSARCPLVNPVTVADRAAANDPSSIFFPCGETRDLVTAPPCKYTPETCTQPLHRASITWEPPKTGGGREYISGNNVAWRNADTAGRYKQYIPMILGGLVWINGIPVAPVGDGNYTRSEVIVAWGEVDVLEVIVNGISLAGSTTIGDFRWHYISTGARDGSPNTDVPYNGTGDPYGNMTAIQVLLGRQYWDPASLPTVRIKCRRKKLRAYRNITSAVGSGSNIVITFDGPNEDCAGNPPFSVTIVGNSWAGANITSTLINWTFGPPGTITLTATGTGSGTGGYLYYETSGVVPASAGEGASSPWPLMEALRWTAFEYSDFDAPYWASSAKLCNATITYTDRSGVSASQARFSTALAVASRRSASEVIRGIRQAIGGYLVFGPTGKLRLLLEGPLAEQQPAPVDGSNYNVAVSSKTRAGAATSGYVAYRFDESNSWNLIREGMPLSSSPNRIGFEFQDPSTGYAISTWGKADSEDMGRVGQEVPGGLQVQPEGIATVNHAARASTLGLAKLLRGNPAGDTKGTDWFTWTTSFRGCRLQIGQIVSLNDTRLGLSEQLVRLTEVKASRNLEEMTLRGHFHNDDWYLDSAGNDADPEYSGKAHDRLARPAFPWCPNTVAPIASDALYDPTDKTFSLVTVTDTDAAGNPIVSLQISGEVAVNSPAAINAPLIGSQGTTATTGGTIPGGTTIYAVVCARVSSSTPSAPSAGICRVDIPSGTNTNTAVIPVLSWDSSTTDYEVYAGTNPNLMTRQASGSGKPTSITLTSLKTRDRGMPDVEMDRIWPRVKKVRHSGILGTGVAAVTSTTITIGGSWTANALVGYPVTLMGKLDGSALPVASYLITANTTGGVLTVTPDPTGQVSVGDCVVVRSKPSVSGSVVSDPLWANPFSGSGLATNAEKGKVYRVIKGLGRGQTYTIASNTNTSITLSSAPQINSTSICIIEEPNWIPTEPTASMDNTDPSRTITAQFDVNNYVNETLLVMPLAIDGGGKGFDSLAPVRENYVFGSRLGIRVLTANATQLITDHTVLLDCTSNDVTYTFLPSAQWKGRRVVVKHWAGATYTGIAAAASGETIDDGSGGSVSSVNLAAVGDVFEVVSGG